MTETLQALGAAAGLAGIAVGCVLYVFRSIIGSAVLSRVPSRSSYIILMTIIICVFAVSISAVLLSVFPDALGFQTGTRNAQSVRDGVGIQKGNDNIQNIGKK